MTKEIVDYLTHGYWEEYKGEQARKHHDQSYVRVGRDDWAPMGDDGVIWISLGNLTGHFREYVQNSFERIDGVIPIDFEYVDGNAQINVTITQSNSWTQRANYTVKNREGEEFADIESANIKFTTRMEEARENNAERVALHEILHTLGLGHPGPYNAGKGGPIFEEDTWDTSLMSYVRGDVRPFDLRMADVQALQVLYGTVKVDELIELYVTYYDRLPDNETMEIWTASYHTGTSVQDMYNTLYQDAPALSPEEMVMNAFNEAFNRDAKAGGINYWANEIEQRDLSQGDFMYTLLMNAGARDRDYLNGAIELGNQFALELELDDVGAAEQAMEIYDTQGYDQAFNFITGFELT